MGAIERLGGDEPRRVFDIDEVDGGRRNGPPYDQERSRVIAQAVVSQTVDGQWKIFVQSDTQVEGSFVGSFEDVMNKLRSYSRGDWHQRSL
jgi:hypothetical protein